MYTRSNPYLARIKDRYLLTKATSTRKTYHIVLSTDLFYQVGDSIAVLPTNQTDIVEQIIQTLKADGTETVFDLRTQTELSFRDFLLTKANLQKCSFHKILPVEKTSLPLLELIKTHQPHPSEICRILLPLMPRFYSIASSYKMYPNEIHLTVAHIEYCLNQTKYFGTGSHFLCHGAKINKTIVPIYIQPSNHFALPKDPNLAIVLIGPGTGVAPFRAFLQQRIATRATGRNWLFFGERNEATDFYYGKYFKELEKLGKLRLSTAFSRDQKEKIYVQNKMWEERKSLWEWIQEGCLVYVCGDAQKMAKDVSMTLQHIFQAEGGYIEKEALALFKQMRKEKRLLFDVY